ncbi:hypothetical protein AVEN_66910-1 [Araneus ventricosus]|uniref:Uncharacterized protein n=1 Tax=Araneus ventricosus TaxID=182803 RepID=A0A4Y2SS46_ARAVE|nr:hypothetical protein AVEN_66910-1 [Araneus ventricosus]
MSIFKASSSDKRGALASKPRIRFTDCKCFSLCEEDTIGRAFEENEVCSPCSSTLLCHELIEAFLTSWLGAQVVPASKSFRFQKRWRQKQQMVGM